jgi:hypothetical protein
MTARDIRHGRRGGGWLPDESDAQRAAREARLTIGFCPCWGLITLVDWEIGTPCSRCGSTFISETEHAALLVESLDESSTADAAAHIAALRRALAS